MSPATSRVVRLGETSLTICYDSTSASAARIVEVVVPGGDHPPAAAANATVEIDAPLGGPVRILRESATLYLGESVGDAAGVLLADITRTLVGECRAGLVLHAGLVGCRGRAILLCGGTGAGKTTLTAWLVRSGLTYASDEIALVPHGEGQAVSYPRPLSFKHAGEPMLDRWISQDIRAGATLSTPLSTLVPPALFGSAAYTAAWAPGAIVFPVRHEARDTDLRHLSTAETAFHLMGTLVNARHLERHGLPAVIRLASRVQGYRLSYRDVEDVRPDALAIW